jgi:transketolase C-terminal domain/subunit
VENRLREGAVGICINCGESISDTDEVAEVVGRFTTSHKVVHVECIKPTDQLA